MTVEYSIQETVYNLTQYHSLEDFINFILNETQVWGNLLWTMACFNNRYDIVEWLVEHENEFPINDGTLDHYIAPILDYPLCAGMFDILDLVYSRFGHTYPFLMFSNEGVERVIKYGVDESMLWICDNIPHYKLTYMQVILMIRFDRLTMFITAQKRKRIQWSFELVSLMLNEIAIQGVTGYLSYFMKGYSEQTTINRFIVNALQNKHKAVVQEIIELTSPISSTQACPNKKSKYQLTTPLQ